MSLDSVLAANEPLENVIFKFLTRTSPGPWSLELLLLLSTLFLSPDGGGRGGKVAGFWGGWGTGLGLLARPPDPLLQETDLLLRQLQE